MAKELTKCAECGREGGRLRYNHTRDVYLCFPGCARASAIRDAAKSTFPFTTPHLVAGQNIEVQSLRHLRQLENRYGVQSAPYNLDSGNLERR